MEYLITSWPIRKMYNLIKENKIDLHPSYQRNFIWGKKDQQQLIDSILNGWPLPTFFVYKKQNGTYEMVDGQQRAETICRFIKGSITNSHKLYYHMIESDSFLKYKLNITEISNIDDATGEKVSAFYALVNKSGIHLNPAEVGKAQNAEHPFMKLAEELLNLPDFRNLNIFSEKTINRMRDRTFIEELVAYLHGGFFDKRDLINEIYNASFSDEETEKLRRLFTNIIKRIGKLNKYSPIKDTRFAQRNDFFSLFTFINEHNEILSDEILLYQYNLLCWIDRNNFIRPSNDDCELLQKYAFACVTQSNSKDSRKTRLRILEIILLNKPDSESQDYESFLEYLRDCFNTEDVPEKNISGYLLIDYEKLSVNND